MSEDQPPATAHHRSRWGIPDADPMEPVAAEPPRSSPSIGSGQHTQPVQQAVNSQHAQHDQPPGIRATSTRRKPSTLARRQSRHWAVLLIVCSLVGLLTALAWQRHTFDQLLGLAPPPSARSNSSTPPPAAPSPPTTGPPTRQPVAPSDSRPASAPPDPNRPAANEPNTTEPNTTEPNSTEPGMTELPAAQPGATDPGATVPSDKEPSDTEPTATEPTATEPAVADPGQVVAIGRQLLEARQAAVGRDWDTARDRLTVAQKALKQAPAEDPDVRQLAEAAHRLGQLIDDAVAYWRAVDQAWEKLQPTSELVIDDRPVAVVEVGPDEIVVRSAGQNRRFARQKLPGKLARAIAASWLDPQRPDNLVLEAAFEALETDFASPRAAELWQAAERAGAQVGDLPQVLTDRYGLP